MESESAINGSVPQAESDSKMTENGENGVSIPNSSFTPEEVAYYRSNTTAYMNATPTIAEPAPVKSPRQPRVSTDRHIPRPSQAQSTPRPVSVMPYQGVDLVAEPGETSNTVSWHEPHPIFVIVLVSPDEIPFGIQKDLLCAQSPYYRSEFATAGADMQVEHIVKLPDTSVEIFGCFQNFIYTSKVYDRDHGREIPDYPLLMGVWKLATKLRMAPLRVAVLETMAERRRLTSCIPGTPLLIQAWGETEEGSGLRAMFVNWAAEHMRTSPEARNAFAKSLPQEILSELVIVITELPSPPLFTPQPLPPSRSHGLPTEVSLLEPPRPSTTTSNKRARKSDIGSHADDLFEIKPPAAKKPARRSEPAKRKSKPSTTSSGAPIPLSPEEDLAFCRGMITRMVHGPGYWTRLVKLFKNPVDPIADNVPNYLEVIKTPMDLVTIKGKMERGEYASAGEFEADVRLIFTNCYTFWGKEEPIVAACGKLEEYFNTQWNTRHKYTPSIKAEVVD